MPSMLRSIPAIGLVFFETGFRSERQRKDAGNENVALASRCDASSDLGGPTQNS
jgi:hypothetical protein